MTTEQDNIDFCKSFGMSTELAHQTSAAVDIMQDYGYSQEKIADVLGAAIRGGHNPEVIARKMVSFAKIVNGEK